MTLRDATIVPGSSTRKNCNATGIATTIAETMLIIIAKGTLGLRVGLHISGVMLGEIHNCSSVWKPALDGTKKLELVGRDGIITHPFHVCVGCSL